MFLNLNEDGDGDFGVCKDTGQELVAKTEMQPDKKFTRFKKIVTKVELKNLVSNQENSDTNNNTKWTVNDFNALKIWRENRA